MSGENRDLDPQIRTLILAERIDERTMALEEGVDRTMEEVNDLKRRVQEQESVRDGILGNSEAGLRRIIREEFGKADLLSKDEIEVLATESARKYSEQQGDNRFNKWVALLGLAASIVAVAITLLL